MALIQVLISKSFNSCSFQYSDDPESEVKKANCEKEVIEKKLNAPSLPFLNLKIFQVCQLSNIKLTEAKSKHRVNSKC